VIEDLRQEASGNKAIPERLEEAVRQRPFLSPMPFNVDRPGPRGANLRCLASNWVMNALKKTILGAGAAFGLLYVALSARTDAQGQPNVNAGKTNVTWLGSVVYGKEAAGVVGGPFPQAQEGIEIGLRSDGVVVWRKTN
jgi:hypothetical protein